MNITKYKNGRESYDFKIDKRDMERFISDLIDDVVKDGVKPGYYWVNSRGKELIKLIVEDKNG
jgi:uncharacterized membrane protein